MQRRQVYKNHKLQYYPCRLARMHFITSVYDTDLQKYISYRCIRVDASYLMNLDTEPAGVRTTD